MLGVAADVSFGLSDINHNGKVYFDQLLSTLRSETSGSIYGFAQLYATVGFGPFSDTFTVNILPDITFFSFSTSCADPVLAHADGQDTRDASLDLPTGTLILNIGPFSNDRLLGATDGNDDVPFPDRSRHHAGYLQDSSFGYGNKQAYDDVTGIYANGGRGTTSSPSTPV